MSIPDAPWIGKCREDYYGYDEEELVRCDDCDEKFLQGELIELDGRLLCKECFNSYYGEEEADDEGYE